MFDVQGWLKEQLSDGTPRHRRISFLIIANGGLEVSSWGFLSYHNGHQYGLEQNDAIELMRYSSFMDGLVAGGIPFHLAFIPYFLAYKEEFSLQPQT